MLDQALIKELTTIGVNHTPEDIVAIARLPDNKIVFLEKGKTRDGLVHIISRHGSQFADHGISIEQIPDVVMAAVTRGVPVGIQGRDRIIYSVEFEGAIHNVAVSIGRNGYIVSANPKSKTPRG
ncbi:MAG: hypothetical protein AAFP03_03970 [Cyanobacteria bacterium J06598_3]